MIITQRYATDITGILSCFDRIILQGTLNPVGHPEGMTSFLYSKNIRIFDFPLWAEQFTHKIRDHVQSVSAKNNVPIAFVRKTNTRKEDIVSTVISTRGDKPGLVCILSAMETCPTFKPWHNKQTGKTYLMHDNSKCLHYYFYFIDPDFGLCHIRVPTWLPCRLQVYINGHNWLASQLKKKNISFSKTDNLFTSISDFGAAQKIIDSFPVEKLHTFLDRYAKTCCPILKDISAVYQWSIMQVEYATDVLFSSPEKLKPLYEHISRSAVIAVKAENVATFLGRKLHANYQDEMGNHFNTRIEGTRIRHSMGPVSIKAYDKLGIAFRIETTCNDITFFKHYRDVMQKDGTIVNKIASMRKSIYSVTDLAKIMGDANLRYLEFLSALDDPTGSAPKLKKLSTTITENNHPYKGFNFFDANDLDLLRIIARGEFLIVGLQNKNLRQYLKNLSPSQISRIIRRLRVHGLIKKIRGAYKYFLTPLGKQVVALGLNLREFFVTPSLALCKY